MGKIIVANWKMNPDSLKKAKNLLADYLEILKNQGNQPETELIIAPPFIYLTELKNEIKSSKLKLAAQDVFWENSPISKGAFTGEISSEMLKNFDVEYVIIGHSERRKYLSETDKIINKKVLSALKSGLKIILCVGEDLSIRKKGKKAVENFIKDQLQKDLKGANKLKANNLIIAYEPIWAIGTGHSDTSQDALEIIKFIKEILNSKFHIQNSQVLYGGSVDAKNAKEFLRHKEIDGALVGHISLISEEFKKIIKVANFS
ncbi:MAG: triose-phosphate isomerase [Patescibacteria group bacterium]